LEGGNLEHVPGFYYEDLQWQSAFTPGFFIPVRDREGRIQALMIRARDRAESGYKYIWFSSAEKDIGASTGSPLHYRISGKGKTLFITEAPLKADYMWLKMGTNVVAGAGVSTAHREMVELALDRRFESVAVCFDGDWRENKHVALQLARLYKSLRLQAGIRADIGVWDSTCGIDDAHQQGLVITFITFAEWWNQINPEIQNHIVRVSKTKTTSWKKNESYLQA
jgi:hypothetical protein